MGREYGGNLSYWNMREFHEWIVPRQISEYVLYTDSRVVGESSRPTSPYKFINMIPYCHEPGVIQEAIVLRIAWVIDGKREFPIRTETTTYNGGWANDELAALASLRLGVRLKAGGETRLFGAYSEDPLGTPKASRNKPDIFLLGKTLVLPSVFRVPNLESLKAIDALKNVSESEFTALVRSARQFQNAIWIAESEPELAWLMLVSAIETAANEWASSLPSRSSAIETLREIKPKFYQQLMDNGGTEALAIVADEIAHTLKAAKKFRDFCMEFLPAPPDERPAEYAQINWTKNALKKALDKIYGYRSLALHAGIPFPSPMCAAPDRIEEEGRVTYAEIGTLGLAAHTLGASWRADDLPMSMNTFCNLVRDILNKWWDAITAENTLKSRC